MRSFHNLVIFCFVIDAVICSLWNCGNSTFAQEHIASTYTDDATKIRNHFLVGSGKESAFKLVAEMADRFGPRIVGSENLENAIDYIIDEYKSDFKVQTGSFQTYKWVRANELATLVEPVQRNLTILGLGTTVPTPPCGIRAEAVVVESFQELAELGYNVQGKIVVFNQPWLSYVDASRYRVAGASEAAKFGAVATLVRAATPLSINSPHTGTQIYQDGVTKIPTASITVEDAQMLARIQTRQRTGDRCQASIRIHLIIESSITDTNVTMRNIIIDYPGTAGSNEVVLIGAHIDSWDVGTGAMDDLSGVAVNLVTLRALKTLGLRPRRTVRVVLWNAEEQFLVGSKAYYNENKDNPNISHVLVLETDAGAFKPVGLKFKSDNETAVATMQSVISLLEPIDAARVSTASYIGDGGQFVTGRGVPGGIIVTKKHIDYYFQFHHSGGDRATVYQNPGHTDHLDYASVLWATLSFAIGDLDADRCKPDVSV